MKTEIEVENGINILTLGANATSFYGIPSKALIIDAGSLAGVLSQMHVLVDFMDKLASVLEIEGDLLPSDHFDLIGASGIAGCVTPVFQYMGIAATY